jgi:predicted metal-dependent hydrolase
MDKQKIQERQQKILDLVREFCAKKLDEEYLELAERLTQKLGRKKNNFFCNWTTTSLGSCNYPCFGDYQFFV